jgi:hypothetical protein
MIGVSCGLTILGLAVLLLPAAATQEPRRSGSLPQTSGEREEFLLKARIIADLGTSSPARGPLRIMLEDGERKHAASVSTSTSPDLSQSDYRFNVAAYELDKWLQLNLVSPSVEREIDGRMASVTWWVDDVLTSEMGRRANNLQPPDRQSWTNQMQAVRVFDELVANVYRDVRPEFDRSTVWDNLLITRQWRVWLIDHTRTFGTGRQLRQSDSLTRCDRTLLRNLRALNAEAFKQRLGRFLTAEQLDALEIRRALIVKHFEELIARNGEAAVLYDLSLKP